MTGHDRDVSLNGDKLVLNNGWVIKKKRLWRLQQQAHEEAAQILLTLGQRTPLVLAGSSSASIVGSPPSPTDKCGRCRKTYSSPSALNGHKRVHNNGWDIHKKWPPNKPKTPLNRPKTPPNRPMLPLNRPMPLPNRLTPPQPKQQVHEEQDEEAALILLMLGQGTLKKIKGKEMKGDGSAVAEGSASSSVAAEGQRKMIRMEFDLSPPSSMLARAGPKSVSSSAPGGAGGSMTWGKELVLAGSSSAATMGSPLPPTDMVYRCGRCRKTYSSPSALNGHKRVHNNG